MTLAHLSAVDIMDQRWRRLMESRVRRQCGPRLASVFDVAWGDLLCATWRSGRPAIDDEGQMWAVLQSFLRFARGRRQTGSCAEVLAEADMGCDLQWVEAKRVHAPGPDRFRWLSNECRKAGKGGEALWLVHARGLSYNEAAEAMGVHVATLKSRLKSGRRALQTRVKKRGGIPMAWKSDDRSRVEQALSETMRGDPSSWAECIAGMLEDLGVDAQRVVEWVRETVDE